MMMMGMDGWRSIQCTCGRIKEVGSWYVGRLWLGFVVGSYIPPPPFDDVSDGCIYTSTHLSVVLSWVISQRVRVRMNVTHEDV